MKKLANAAPVLFFLTQLLYPICALLTFTYGMRRTAFLYTFLTPVVVVLSLVLGSIWFVSSKEGVVDVNIVHVIFAVLAPALSFINGVCLLRNANDAWSFLSVILMWIEAIHIPMGCFSLASGERLRSILMLIACTGAMLVALWIIYPLIAGDIFAISLFERIF